MAASRARQGSEVAASRSHSPAYDEVEGGGGGEGGGGSEGEGEGEGEGLEALAAQEADSPVAKAFGNRSVDRVVSRKEDRRHVHRRQLALHIARTLVRD